MWEELLNSARPGTRPVRAGAVNLAAHSVIVLAAPGDAARGRR
jgi:hypothetical protein